MKRIKSFPLTVLLTALLGSSAGLLAADKKAEKKAKPYPLNLCVVSNEKLDSMGEPFVFVHEGREVKLCCKDCRKDFDKNTAKFVAKIDEAAKKVKPYPLQLCVVSDEKLDSMGEPFVFIHDGQEIKLCCKDCKKDFDKNAAKFTAKLSKAKK
ncbi:MAG: hypothetical protein FJ398_21680 [Verrucomicrobia bacterium]|nr:hypothetical protein [Verrucomicrobiota bacterium]